MKNSQMKNLFLLLFFLLAAAMPLFADVIPPGLKSAGDEIEGFFTSTLVTAILIACLAGCGIAYAFNKDNEKMKRNLIAIGIGIIIIGTAKEIVRAIMAIK